jgi:hypothetical protein
MTSHQDEPRRHAPGMPQAGDAAVPTADAGEASNHLGQDDGADVERAKHDAGQGDRRGDRHGRENEQQHNPPPRAPGGLATGLQPGGTAPGGGPAASAGSIGTGGASTGGAASGAVKRGGK